MRRLLFLLITALALAGALVVVNVLGPSADSTGSQPAAASARGSINSLQDHLEQQPGDAGSWAALGQLYIEESRVTSDPAYYAKAEGALSESLRLQPDANDAALSAQAALAAARHDFGTALALAEQALAINGFSATALAARTDALTELGRYEEALTAAERADATRPSLATFTRLAYQHELRGDLTTARELFDRALSGRPSSQDIAFVRHHLGQIAQLRGDVSTARAEYAAALDADPDHLPSLAAQARLSAADGDVDDALTAWSSVVARAPLPEYLTEYGELLESVGRADEARQQYDTVHAAYAIAQSYGATNDLELALFEADHGDPVIALRAAESEWARRQSVHAADAYAWALHANGRDAEALVLVDRALALGTQDPLFLRHRSEILAALGSTS